MRHCQASPSPTRTSHRASTRPNPNLQQEGLPLIQSLKRAEFFAVSNIRRRFMFGEPGMQRREISEIPREAVANALCHRDYTTGTAVEVNVYMDFVEVVSPGLFPEGDAPENHLAGADGGLKQRNPNIAQALFRSGMIEQYGTGIPRIKRACDVAGVAFSYRQDVNATVIRFERTGSQVNDRGNIAADGTTVIAPTRRHLRVSTRPRRPPCKLRATRAALRRRHLWSKRVSEEPRRRKP